jgi:Flp pilus assembly pilin Flp
MILLAQLWLFAATRRAPAWMRAQSTVEYAVVGALVVIAAAAALTIMSGQITAVFGNISNTLKTAGGTH